MLRYSGCCGKGRGVFGCVVGVCLGEGGVGGVLVM